MAASTLQIVIGIFTAIIANQPFIKGKRIFGVIFLLPWAVPAFITILTFSNMFNDSVGAINTQVLPILAKFLPFLDGTLIPWKTDPTWTKIALIMMQGWLGFPYIYVLTLGILQSIPNDLYEAAYIDGANAWQKFRNITFPMILAVAAPTLISQYTFNFNNFSIMYLFNAGGPGSVGAINTQVLPIFAKFLPFLDGVLIPWKTNPTWTKIALIMMQGWLGFPYIYVLTLGILQSIPNDLYEAAYIDGANAWQKFRNITFPMILAVAAPTLISQIHLQLQQLLYHVSLQWWWSW